MREYLRRGEVAMLRMGEEIKPDVWRRIDTLATLGEHVWTMSVEGQEVWKLQSQELL